MFGLLILTSGNTILPGGSHADDSLLNRLLSVFDILNKHTFSLKSQSGCAGTDSSWRLTTHWAIIVVTIVVAGH